MPIERKFMLRHDPRNSYTIFPKLWHTDVKHANFSNVTYEDRKSTNIIMRHWSLLGNNKSLKSRMIHVSVRQLQWIICIREHANAARREFLGKWTFLDVFLIFVPDLSFRKSTGIRGIRAKIKNWSGLLHIRVVRRNILRSNLSCFI